MRVRFKLSSCREQCTVLSLFKDEEPVKIELMTMDTSRLSKTDIRSIAAKIVNKR
jgi:hypothetical protein